jgi:ABC-type multidrug transport system ATPase subunit
MGLIRQVFTLTTKNLRLEVLRHAFSTVFRALLLPAAFILFLGEAQNFFVAPSTYGIGAAVQVLPLLDALSFHGIPSKVVLVNSGYTIGEIDHVIGTLAQSVKSAGKEVILVSDESSVPHICPNSIRQISDCYSVAVFHSSPSEGSGGIWNYTILIDAGRGYGLHVDSPSNDVDLYPIPFQHAIDTAISSVSPAMNHSQLPQQIFHYSYTEETETDREEGVRSRYEGTIRTALAVAYFLGQIGVIYHLVGMMTFERERGISQLLEAMMPNKQQWQPQFARLLSYHLAFTIIYFPGWIVMAFITRYTVFRHANTFILLAFYLLSGMSLVSSSIFGAAFFRRAQLSAVSVTGISLILGLIGMLFASGGNLLVGLLSLFFPPIATVNFIEELAYWEGQGRSIDLHLGAPSRSARYPGLVYWYCMLLQIFVYPLLAAFVEKAFFQSRSRNRILTQSEKMSASPIRMTGLFISYALPWYRRLGNFITHRYQPMVQAVNGVTANIARGQITVLLGPNGSGKTSTVRCIAGLERATGGLLEIENAGSLGICPQENIFWDLLTVEEHLKILTAIKQHGPLDPQLEVKRLIQACDLDTKANALARSLSGGQKRKLQLAMMFAAGSRLCCVDEVSSGLDPRSRRKICEILLAERGERTFLLTTHFLDEAETLADSILILSKGSLTAMGSAVELKQKHGGDYRIHLTNTPELRRRDTYALSTDMSALLEQGTLDVQNSSDVARIADELDKSGVSNYGITGPSMENVLFNVLQAPLHVESIGRGSELNSRSAHPGGLGRSMRILLGKRLIVFKRNFVAHLLAMLIPPIVAGIASIFLHNYNGMNCGANFVAQQSPTDSSLNLPVFDFLIGPSSQISPRIINSISESLGGRASSDIGSFLHQVETLDAFNEYVRDNFTNLNPGGIFLGQGTSKPTFAYLADGPMYNSIFTQNLLDRLLTNITIITQYRDIPSSFEVR